MKAMVITGIVNLKETEKPLQSVDLPEPVPHGNEILIRVRKCPFCLNHRENLCESFTATGRDANGGYAQYMKASEQYAYPIPEVFTDSEAAPLLCAGAIGYRSLELSGLKDGQNLGLTGF